MLAHFIRDHQFRLMGQFFYQKNVVRNPIKVRGVGIVVHQLLKQQAVLFYLGFYLKGPIVAYSDKVGNRGLTGIVIIETSHIAFHSWDESLPAVIQLDIYSCKDFEPKHIFKELEVFNLYIPADKRLLITNQVTKFISIVFRNRQ